MSDEQTRAEVARLIADPQLLALRIAACESAAKALKQAAEYLHIPAAVGGDENVKGLSLLVDMASDMTESTVLLFKAQHWYSGTALIRQLIEAEYLIVLCARDPSLASQWLNASAKQLRNWWSPAAMRAHLGGDFDDREYWDHCERGGHPAPSAAPFLDGLLNKLDRRFCWIDFTTHCRRVFFATVRCFEAFGFRVHLEGDAYVEAYNAFEAWKNNDPAPSILQRIPRVGEKA